MSTKRSVTNGFDYATSMAYADPRYLRSGFVGQAYPPHPYSTLYGGRPYMNGYSAAYNSAYGADGYHYMRNFDPSYDAFFPEGPSVDDKWRSTYPYVPTSYLHHSSSDRNGSVSKAGSTINGISSGVSAHAKDPEEGGEHEREKWGSKWEFIFSCVGLSVGIGNVWRFPYLAYENGGGAFLIPYFILLLVVGKPMYLMECALGQFTQASPVAVWKLAPIGRGIGFAMVTISLIVAIYYNILMGYCFHYMFASFTSVLPWETCDPAWADLETCYVRSSNATCNSTTTKCQSSTEQYWERYVLGLHKADFKTFIEPYNSTTDIEVNRTYVLAQFGDIGEIKWDLCLCVLLAWIVIFICLSKGIQSSGKVVYFTATFPYVILIILLVKGLLLEGASEGVWYFFVPRWEKLMEIQVWRKAAEQMFFSLSVSWGGLIMFGSYNKFRNPVHHQAFAISLLDFATSIIAGVVVFSILGELKVKLGVDDISTVVKSGQGLAFVAYPEAVTHIALPPLWSFLFFFMLFLLGLDSEFALLETVLSGIYDLMPKARKYKPLVTLSLCSALFLISLPCVSYSGTFVFDIMDTYGGGLAVFWLAIFETIAIMWIYGVRRFADDIGFMLKINVSWYWKICWPIAPVILIAIFGISIYYWTLPTYGGIYHYPDWAHGIGWFLTLIVTLQIPLGALIMLIYYSIKGRPLDAFRPTPDFGPGDTVGRQEWIQYKQSKAATCRRHPYVIQTYPVAYDNPAMYYPNGYQPNDYSNYQM